MILQVCCLLFLVTCCFPFVSHCRSTWAVIHLYVYGTNDGDVFWHDFANSRGECSVDNVSSIAGFAGSAESSLLPCIVLAHVMSDVSFEIEASERRRARVLASHLLQPARVVGRRRFRASRHSVCLSCLRDSIYTCARHSHLVSLQRELSVVRRDVVRAGLQGSRRAASNFHTLKRILIRQGMFVAVLSAHEEHMVRHDFGFETGSCIGVILWDSVSKHATPLPPCFLDGVASTTAPQPWSYSSVGGKKPKAKATAKAKSKVEAFTEDVLRAPEEFEDISTSRMPVEPDISRSLARNLTSSNAQSKSFSSVGGK